MKKLLAGLCSVSLALSLVMPFAASPASAETILPTRGSPGDREDPDRCPPGHYLFGVKGRVGSWVDQIRIVCAPLQSDGRIGPPEFEGPVRGGNTGGIAAGSCPAGAAVGSLGIYFTEEHRQVKYLSMECRTPQGGVSGYTGMNARGDADNIDTKTIDDQSCRDGELATGMVINSGRHVNGLGLICDRLVAVVASAPPPPKVLKSTGKMPPPSGSPVALFAAFQGTWLTVTSSNSHFTMFIQQTGPYNPMVPSAPVEFRATFINTDGANQFDGTLWGTVQPGANLFTYRYIQPRVSSEGAGRLVLSSDGNSFTGTGMQDGKEFTWNGTRTK